MGHKSQVLRPANASKGTGLVPVRSFVGDLPSSAVMEQTSLFRSWLTYDSEFESTSREPRSIFLGLIVAFGISGTFWAGMALLIARSWK